MVAGTVLTVARLIRDIPARRADLLNLNNTIILVNVAFSYSDLDGFILIVDHVYIPLGSTVKKVSIDG